MTENIHKHRIRLAGEGEAGEHGAPVLIFLVREWLKRQGKHCPQCGQLSQLQK